MAPRPVITAGMLFARNANGTAPRIAADGQACFRMAQLDTRAINAEARTAEFSFSSDIELERWPGVIEVLSHAPDAVDMSRLRSGAPLLFNHDVDEYVGVVESATIGADRKGRCVVRFSESDDGEKVWRDVQAGILRNVSVGYRIRDVKLTEERDGVDVYTVTRWEPYEVSIVTVPADITVGIGRDARSFFTKPQTSPIENTLMNREQMIAALRARGITVADDISDADLTALMTRSLAPAPAPTHAPAPTGTRAQVVNEPAPTAADGAAAERDRVRSIFAAGKQYDAADLAQEAVEKGHTLDQFRTALIDHVDKRNKSVVEGTKPIGMSEKEARGFSFIKLVRALSADPENRAKADKEAAFELEACRAAADQMTHRSAKGTVIPSDVLLMPLNGQRTDTIVGAKTASGYTNAGTNSIQTLLLTSSFIDLLRNRSIMMGRMVELGGLVGNIDIPKQLTGPAASWIGEDEAADATGITFGLVSLRPKTLSARGELTRKLLMQNSLGVEALFRSDLATVMALEIDRAALYGSNANNEPKGLVEYTIGARYWAANNAPTFAELVGMETAIANANADVNSMSYIATPGFRGHAKTTRKFSDGNDGTIWEPGNTVNGYACGVSNQLIAGDVFFGDWSQFLMGMWGGLDITVDPYTHSDKGRIRVTQFQDVDFTVRREESFAIGRNLANS
jgi:HK97 family phage major capsid protein/HK97 family phage prohead protease